MFKGAMAFNQALLNWNTSSVTNMSMMFKNAVTFTQNLLLVMEYVKSVQYEFHVL